MLGAGAVRPVARQSDLHDAASRECDRTTLNQRVVPEGVRFRTPGRAGVRRVRILGIDWRGFGISNLCARCGRPANEGDRFCAGCGAELTTACVHCGRSLPADAAYCTGCGKARSDQRADGAPTATDRRRISVLFVDLIDFTPYVERADPELVRELQNDFFATARQVIGQYGGVVEKYIGDAVMALFGAPVATETDAVRCVRAGLELQRVLSHYDDPARSLRFRVGVATGEAIVDVAAARDGGQAIVAGDVVNTASRLQSLAPAGGVLVCGITTPWPSRRSTAPRSRRSPCAGARRRPRCGWPSRRCAQPPGPRDRLDAAGQPHPRAGAAGQRPAPRLARGHTAAGDRARARRHRQEPAGARALPARRRLFDASIAWRTGRCPPFGENVTFAALADIVKAQAGILDTDTADTARERLDAALLDSSGRVEVARLSDPLGPLVGLPGPKLAADETESAWRRFVVALAAHRPTVLVFEDLHWADESMVRFVERLGASVRDVPLLLLCAARPELLEREPSWAGAIPGSVTITLPPLRDAEIATMYTHLFGQGDLPAGLLGPLVELADGNPLYAPEYTRMLVEQGALRPFDALTSARAADAGQRPRGHRQPGRPARGHRPRGAAGGRRGGDGVLAGRGRRGDGWPAGRRHRAVAAPRSSSVT